MTQEMVGERAGTRPGRSHAHRAETDGSGFVYHHNQDTDVAIEGNGMFVLKGSYGGSTGTYYTRDGQFTIDKNGYMVNEEGYACRHAG